MAKGRKYFGKPSAPTIPNFMNFNSRVKSVHCAGGYRSMIAASILKSWGYHNFIDIAGGIAALKNADLPMAHGVKEVNN